MRLPKQVFHDPAPFNKQTYMEPEDRDEEDESEKINAKELERRRAEGILNEVEHTMRWRWVRDQDGTMVSPSCPDPQS